MLHYNDSAYHYKTLLLLTACDLIRCDTRYWKKGEIMYLALDKGRVGC